MSNFDKIGGHSVSRKLRYVRLLLYILSNASTQEIKSQLQNNWKYKQ